MWLLYVEQGAVIVGDEDEGPLSWAKHADDLALRQLALALLRADLSGDDDQISAAASQVQEMIRQAAHDIDAEERLSQFDAELITFALRFGIQAFGSPEALDAELAELQRGLADHIAEYEPPTE